MSFDLDPSDDRTQLEECIAEIKRLEVKVAKLEAVAEAAKAVAKYSKSDGGSRLILECDLNWLDLALVALEADT